MKRQDTYRKLLPAGILTVSTIIVLSVLSPVFAPPGTTYPGTTILTFSDNPATLSGDSTPDVTITTTTTSAGGASLISEGKVMIELATDGLGNPVPAGPGVVWGALNSPGQNPDASGVTEYDLDLDNVVVQIDGQPVVIEFTCGTVAGFQAHYVTGGGNTKVATHFSEPVDLTVECGCECETTESAYAYGGTCFSDIDADGDGEAGDFSNWGWSIGPLAEGSYSFDIYAAAGQCNLDNGMLVGRLDVLYTDGTATVTYVMDTCRTLIETHVYVGSDQVPTGPSGDPTVAPGQYGNSNEGTVDEPIGDGDQYVIDGLSGDIYLIAHAKVCVE